MSVKAVSILFTGKIGRSSEASILPQNAGSGVGPKNNRSIFSLPITRTGSCAVQHTRTRINKMI